MESFEHKLRLGEQLKFQNLPLQNVKLTGDEEDTCDLSNCLLTLTNERFVIFTNQENTSGFYCEYYNCVSQGASSDGILLFVSDVLLNDKLEKNPDLIEEISEKSKDSVFQDIKSKKKF